MSSPQWRGPQGFVVFHYRLGLARQQSPTLCLEELRGCSVQGFDSYYVIPRGSSCLRRGMLEYGQGTFCCNANSEYFIDNKNVRINFCSNRKASRVCIPEEYCLIGASMNSPRSAHSMIHCSRARNSCREPINKPLIRMSSRPDSSLWKPGRVR